MLANLRSHFILIAIGSFLSAFSLACIIKFTDPYSSGIATHFFFYTSLFMLTLGIFMLAGIALRQRFLPGLYVTHLAASFRQSLFLSLLIIISLILQAHGLLFWWIGAVLVLFFLSLEVFLNLK